MTAYDNDNIFAKILRGEIPCFKLYEDEHTFVFMDIMPRTDGHCLVIPKTPVRNMLDIGEDDLNAVMKTVKMMIPVTMEAMGAQGVYLVQANEAASGQEVFHLHVHVIPRREGVPMRPPASIQEDMGVLEENTNQIRAVLER